MAVEKVYHVYPREENWWKGEEEGAETSLMEARNKGILVQRMEDKAKLNRPSRLIIHSVDGRVEKVEKFEDRGWATDTMDKSLMSDG